VSALELVEERLEKSVEAVAGFAQKTVGDNFAGAEGADGDFFVLNDKCAVDQIVAFGAILPFADFAGDDTRIVANAEQDNVFKPTVFLSAFSRIIGSNLFKPSDLSRKAPAGFPNLRKNSV
jgi:hypothetical protein